MTEHYNNKINRKQGRSRNLPSRTAMMTLTICLSCVAIWFLYSSGFFKHALQSSKNAGSEFTYGSIPTEETILELERENYDAVISLLHRKLVPFEPIILDKIKLLTEKHGIKLLEFPLLPRLADNSEVLRELEEFVTKNSGKYYIHAYDDYDRLKISARVINRTGSRISYHDNLQADDADRIGDLNSFRSGKIVKLDDDVYLAPHPTEDEFYHHINVSDFRIVVSMYNVHDFRDSLKLLELIKLCKYSYLRFKNYNLKVSPFNPYHPLQIAHEIRKLPRPLLIITMANPSAAFQGLQQAYFSNEPALPPILFDKWMSGGRIRVITPNLAEGPRPTEDEFDGYLFPRGIRKALYIGHPESKTAEEDFGISFAAGIEWQASEYFTRSLVDSVSHGGPWYLYGPGSSTAAADIQRRFGPALPDSFAFDLDELPILRKVDEGMIDYTDNEVH